MNANPAEDDKSGRAIEVRKRINGVSIIGTIERGPNKEFLVTNYEFVKSDALDASNKTPELNVRNDSDIAKVKKDIETIKESAKNSSQVVYNNGEPNVVMHNSPRLFTEFNKGKIGTSTDWGAFGKGFYFSNKEHTLYIRPKQRSMSTARQDRTGMISIGKRRWSGIGLQPQRKEKKKQER